MSGMLKLKQGVSCSLNQKYDQFLFELYGYFFRYGVGSFSFASIISGVTARFSTPAELQQVCPP